MIAAKRITMLVVSFALFMDVLDSNILNTAIPVMAQFFHVGPIDIKIALISYLLSLAIFIPASGWTADKYGVKPVFISAIGIFTLSSFFCGHAHTLYFLVMMRFLQGMGGAFMISVGRLIIARNFAKHELMDAMNTVIIVVAAASMIGPFVGGFIVDHFVWQWIFWVNVPAGIIMMIVAGHFLKETAPKNPRPFDLLGFIFFGGSLSLLSYSLSKMSESHSDIRILSIEMVSCILMLIAYLFHAHKKTYPIIKLKLFSFHTFRISVFGNLISRLGFGGMPFLLPLLQQVGLGFSAQLSGLLLMPVAIGVVFSKFFSAKILRKVGYKLFLISNTIFVGIVLLIFQFIGKNTPIYCIVILTFIFGVFNSAQYTAMNSLAFAEISESDLSFSTSITSTIQMMGQSIGVAIAAILLRVFSKKINQLPVLAESAFHHAFIALGIITMLSSLIFFRLRTGEGSAMLRKSEAVNN